MFIIININIYFSFFLRTLIKYALGVVEKEELNIL